MKTLNSSIEVNIENQPIEDKIENKPIAMSFKETPEDDNLWWWPKPHEAIDVEDDLIEEVWTPGRRDKLKKCLSSSIESIKVSEGATQLHTEESKRASIIGSVHNSRKPPT